VPHAAAEGRTARLSAFLRPPASKCPHTVRVAPAGLSPINASSSFLLFPKLRRLCENSC
jgi:hypothetical protein